MNHLPCRNFTPTKGCEIGRPVSSDYCLNKCPAYTPAGFDRALLDAWIEAIAYLPKSKGNNP
jgi:hypothetical protein